MLQNARLLQRLPDITTLDLDMAPSFAGIIQQHPIANDVRFALGEVTPAAASNQRTTVTRRRGYKKGEDDSDEQGDQSLNYATRLDGAAIKLYQATHQGRSISIPASHEYRSISADQQRSSSRWQKQTSAHRRTSLYASLSLLSYTTWKDNIRRKE